MMKILMFAMALISAGDAVLGQVTQRTSVDSSGAQVGLGGMLPGPPEAAESLDGRFVVFVSPSAFDSGDVNGTWDVFLRDRLGGMTERLSIATAGTLSNGPSGLYSIAVTPDARFIVFDSLANNLVPGDVNGVRDIFIRDRVSGTTELVSKGTGGVLGNGACAHAAVTPSGQFVTFESEAGNLVAGDSNGMDDIFVRDCLAGSIELVSIASSGAQGDSWSEVPSISDDGRFVAFDSASSTLVPGDTNGRVDVFLRDRQQGTTIRLSVSSAGTQGNMNSYFSTMSGDGRYVAFASDATNLVAGDTNNTRDVFVRDVLNNTTERVSMGPGAVQANYSCTAGFISADGRYLAFASGATNFIPGIFGSQVWVRDLRAATTDLVSTSTDGVFGNGASEIAYITPDGRYVAFRSSATNLVPGDTNGNYDVFIHDRLSAGFTSLCDPGLNGTIACPCGNQPSSAGRGCDNSSSTGGASLSASGIAYMSIDSLAFTTSDEKPSATSILLQGDASISNGLVFGQGVRCVGGTLKRLYVKTAANGSITAPDSTAGDPSVSARSAQLGVAIQPGQPYFFLVYYRDPIVLGGCSAGNTFNATQTGSVTYWP